MCNDIAYLCTETITQDDYGNEITAYTETKVFVDVKSIGYREFYAAATTSIKPDLTLVMSNYLEYNGEKVVKYKSKYYDVVRSYKKNQRMELTLTERISRND